MGRVKQKDVTYKIQFRKYGRQSTNWSSISSNLIDLPSVKGRRVKWALPTYASVHHLRVQSPETQKEVLDPLALGF